MSIITTGINIVATGVSSASSKLKAFGATINGVKDQADKFANQYNRSTTQVIQSSSSLKRALNSDWDAMYRSAMSGTKNQEKALQRLENAYDRTFREIGNKYQSMVMGSVALSMSGVGIMNFGTATLGATKAALDQARDFETVMSQIQFYGQKTKEEMQGIQKEIFKMGFDLPVKTSEIGNAVLSAQKLGYSDTTQAQMMAKEASKIQFMSLDKLDGDESLKFISHMTKLTGTQVENAGQLTDKLTMASDVSAASVDTLWKTIQSSRTAFDSLNTDVNTFLTLAGVMSDRLQPRQAGQALNSFAGGIQMGEKAAREDRGTRGEYYNQLRGAMGGKGFDDFGGDTLAYVQAVADKSKEIWGEGSERTGNIQSIFGKSAMDLFYAVDAYNSSTGRSMLEMREEISKSDGHAQKLMDTLMNGSYGTEKRLEAMIEQFQILFGQTLRPAFNTILDAITKVIGKVNEFMTNHPKWAKALGYGVGLAGLLAVATGATFMFVGGILAIYASLANVMIQLARNTKVIHLLGQGYSTAGQMIKGNFLGPLGLLGKNLLKFSGITFFMYMAWKNDFLRMRTTLIDWYNYTRNGLGKARELFEIYGATSAQQWNLAFKKNQRNGVLDNWITDTALKAMVLGDAIKDIWSDGTVDAETYHKLNDMGLLGFVEKVYEIKTAVTDFWKGFQEGAGEGLRLLKDITAPLRKAWGWVSDKLLEILQHFGYFENVNKGITHKWEQWGAKLGVMVGAVIGIKLGLWAWWRAIKLVISPFAKVFKLTKGIWNLLSKLKGFKMGNIFKAMSWVLPPPLRRLATGFIGSRQAGVTSKRNQRRMTGAYSNIPNARQTPTGGTTYAQPRTLRERMALNKQRRTQGSIMTGKNGSSGIRRSRTLGGTLADFWYGRQYAPDERVDKRGRKYNQIRTMDGGVMRSTADGKVKGRSVRTGRGMKGFLKDAWGVMSNRNMGIVAGGGSPRVGTGGAEIGKKSGGLFKSLGKGIGKASKSLGKGLLKGLGSVVTKGLPLLFKGALKLIPILGWAMLAWDAVKLVFTNWDAIKNGASTAWNWIKTKGVEYLGSAWNWIKTKAGETWNWIKTTASSSWESIKNWASNSWNTIKNKATSLMNSAWETIKGYATSAWNWISTTASSTWETIKGGIATAFSNVFQPIKDAWTEAKNYVTNNPITQTVNKVVKTVSESKWNPLNWGGGRADGSNRTGLWKVPKDGYRSILHQGEMVLTRKEAQIMRSMVGSDNNSISEMLLNKGKGESSNISIKGKDTKRQISIKPTVKQETTKETSNQSGETKVEFKEGAIQISVANASEAEIKKGAKKLFEEFKRMIELENTKNYRPARPRRI